MSTATPQRFYKSAEARPTGTGHGVWLDERRLKTPQRADFAVPTAALAAAIAAEWNGQGAKVEPRSMPLTGLANAAIDRIAPDSVGFAQRLAAYGEHDLLCYRADRPVDLVARQARLWQPVLDWLAQTHGATLALAEGVVHVDQPAESLAALNNTVSRLSPFSLAALQILTTGTGSLTLGLAILGDRLGVEEAQALARIDEEFQIEQWGRDAEAEARTTAIFAELAAAARFAALLG